MRNKALIKDATFHKTYNKYILMRAVSADKNKVAKGITTKIELLK